MNLAFENCGPARLALMALISAGVCGTYHTLAHQAGVPPKMAGVTLRNLRRARVVGVAGYEVAGVGRPRAIYAPARCAPAPGRELMAHLQGVWR